MAGPDLSVFSRNKSFNDYQRLNDEFEQRKALQQAQIQSANVQAYKAMQPDPFDADKVGEQAFVKLAQGLPINPQEAASIQFINAKSGGMMFDPVTQTAMEKPDLLTKAGLKLPSFGTAQPMQQPAPNQPLPAIPKAAQAPAPQYAPQEANAAITDIFTPAETTSQPVVLSSDKLPAPEKKNDFVNEFEQNYKNLRAKAVADGNRNLVQDLDKKYQQGLISMNESESKAAGFADRMIIAAKEVKAYEAAGLDPAQEILNRTPAISNFVISDDKQSLNQAQRDFINALLRRESGATIQDAEFDSAKKQYFPEVGDQPQVLAQKEANRMAAVKGIIRSAGIAYKPTEVEPVKTTKKSLDAEFEARKVATPEEISAYKKMRGIQ